MQCTNKCGVNGQLASSKQRKAVNDPFPATVCGWNWQVQISDQHVGSDPSPCLSADATGCAFQREPPAPQHTSPRTCCSVVAKLIDLAATPACMQRQGFGQSEATQERCGGILVR